jgi:hypothetical protein
VPGRRPGLPRADDPALCPARSCDHRQRLGTHPPRPARTRHRRDPRPPLPADVQALHPQRRRSILRRLPDQQAAHPARRPRARHLRP